MMGWDSAKMEKYHEQHLAKLHDKLKLTAQQEPAWKKFTANNPMADKSLRPDPAEMAKLNVPQRLEKGLEHMKAMEAKMTEHLAALKEFYAVLTPEQQKIFDEETPHGGMRDHRREMK
jgi:periplasmic protein CpxP/Spy